MKPTKTGLVLAALVSLQFACSPSQGPDSAAFSYDGGRFEGEATPWTSDKFPNDSDDFQFAIIGDRTGGANAEGTFELAVGQINLLMPEFVINVGDSIEGYSEEKAKLHAEWDDFDEMATQLEMPFFRTPGNHDIANDAAQEVWIERYGATHYYFVYKNVLFLVLDSEDPPRPAPEGIEEKLETYNRLQAEDPAKAKAMLAEFMSDEAVIAALTKPVEFDDEQMSFIESTLERHPDVRWTFVFLHEPAWENPSESFKAIEEMLATRRHTIFAGHLHYYDYDNIDGFEHITMGPAGASFHQEGPGNVDHIAWVTMTGDGPEIGNIALKGIFDRKGLDPSLFGAYDRKGVAPSEAADE
jgi:hypothetical protein